MTDKETIKASKFLSLILRHEPERVGLKLGEAGWVSVDELLQAVNCNGVPLTLDQLKHIVATSDKKRFAFSEDGQRIRANQGHSVEVDLQWLHWSKAVAPEVADATRRKWQLSWTDYSKLTDDAKEADRVWARKVVALLRERQVIP